MKNVSIIPGQFMLVYHQKIGKSEKEWFLEKIGATIVKNIGVKHELQIDLIIILNSNDLWSDFDLKLDAERIAIHIELLSGHQMTCIPNRSIPVIDQEDTSPIFQRGEQDYDTTNFGNVTFPNGGPPNDTLYPTQWGITNAMVNPVWENYRLVGANVTVGVFDSGSNPEHPDLRTTFVTGYNFLTTPISTDTQDTIGHGTSVSGIIAATTNNDEGIAAVAPGSKVMPFKVINDAHKLHMDVWVAALSFVIEESTVSGKNLVDIINMSLGIYAVLLTKKEMEVLKSLINTIVNKLGILVVASAGNQGWKNTPRYPSGLESVITVGAIDANNQLASFSDVSPTSVDVAAPGVDIVTTVIGPTVYGEKKGTSFAAPIVSGILALMLERINNVGLVVENKAVYLKEILCAAATKDDQTGVYWKYGRVNALRAIELIPVPQETQTDSAN